MRLSDLFFFKCGIFSTNRVEFSLLHQRRHVLIRESSTRPGFYIVYISRQFSKRSEYFHHGLGRLELQSVLHYYLEGNNER